MFKKILMWGGISLAGFFVLIVSAAVLSPDTSESVAGNVQETVQATTTEDTAVVQSLTTDVASAAKTVTVTKAGQTSAPSPSGSSYYAVSSVVDGDTVKISINGTVETLRLIGIDTPETVDPRKPVQCFGKEASAKAKELLSGKKVRIEKDSSQGERDKYSRLLAYVFLEDGTNFNQYMIEQGYAHEYTYNSAYKYQAAFKAAQKWAQSNQKGLWSPSTCIGSTSSATVSSEPASTSQTPAPTVSTSGKFYTSSHYSSKYYYPESCEEWQTLSPANLKSFATLEALLASYSRTKSPQCE